MHVLLACSLLLAAPPAPVVVAPQKTPEAPPKAASPAPGTPAPAVTPPATKPATRPSLAVFQLEAKHGVPAGAADLLTETLLAEVRASGVFERVVSPVEIAALMRPEQQQFLLRCASDECALVDNELAGALGVTHILVGNLGKLGASYLLNLRLLDVQSSVLLSSLSERAQGASEEALLDLVRPSARRLLRDAGMVKETASAERAPTPLRNKVLRGAGAALLAGGGGVMAAAVAALLGVAAVTAYNAALGWRPGGAHHIPAVLGLVSDVAYVGGGGLALLAILGLGAGTVLLIVGLLP